MTLVLARVQDVDQVPDQVTGEFFDSENANKGGVTLSVANAEALFALVDPLEGVCDATSFASISKRAMSVEEALPLAYQIN